MAGPKEAQVLVKMSSTQREQLADLAAQDGVPVRAYILHHLLGVPYEELPLKAGGQPREKRAPRNRDQPPLLEAEAGVAAA